MKRNWVRLFIMCLSWWLGVLVVQPAFADTFQKQLGQWFAQGKHAEIEEALSAKLAEEPQRTDLWMELASLRKSLGDYSGAIQAYQKCLARNNDWTVERALAQALVQKMEFANARPILERLEKEHQGDPEILWGLARLNELQSRVEKADKLKAESELHLREAQKWLLALTAAKPDFPLAYWELAEVSRVLDDRDQALSAYGKAVKQDGSFKWAHRYMAELLVLKGEYKEALGKFEQAMAVEPENQKLKKEAHRASLMAPREAQKNKQERIKQWREWALPEEKPLVPSSVTVRIGLGSGLVQALLRSDSALKVTSPAQTPITLLLAKTNYRVSYRQAKDSADGKETWTLGEDGGKSPMVFNQRIWIEPEESGKAIALNAVSSNPGYFFAREEDRAYRGILEISPKPGAGFKVINRVSLEACMAGVLPAEMPPQWPSEALKAQAVVARTYVLSKLGRHNDEGFDLCDSVHCQVYRGVRAEITRSNAAINDTAGWVLKRGKKIVPVVFSAQCGGHTQDYEEAWGYPAPVVGVKDYDDKYNRGLDFPLTPAQMEIWIREDPVAHCRASELGGYKNYRWAWTVSAEEIQKRAGPIGRVRKLQVLKRSSAGWAKRVVVDGDQGSKEFKGDSIRRFLGGIRSNLVWIEPQFNLEGWPEKFTVYGGGWGHGVGMCQVGAYGLARGGKDFKEILKHYFPKASLEKLETEKDKGN